MQLERKHGCPLRQRWDETTQQWIMGECAKLDCEWFQEMEFGAHPQTGEKVKEWGCAQAWNPIVALQTSRDVRAGTKGIQKALESFRNVTGKAMREFREETAKAKRVMIALQMQNEGHVLPEIQVSTPIMPAIEDQTDGEDIGGH